MSNTLALTLMLLCSAGLFAAMVIANWILGPKKPNPVKDEPYESGSTPLTGLPAQTTPKFYLIAMLFIIFDVETIFLIPWAILYQELRFVGLVEIAFFILVLVFGYLYIWRKGGFKWN